MAVKKLGHPVLLSYFMSDLNNCAPQPAHTKTPLRYSALSGLVKRRSVPSLRSTSYCSGVRSDCHCVSGFSMCPMFDTPCAHQGAAHLNSHLLRVGCYVICDKLARPGCCGTMIKISYW